MMTEERRPQRHWQLLCRVFGIRDGRSAGAAEAASVMGVPRDELRVLFDVNLTSANRHAMTVKLLAHMDERVATAEKALAEVVALRHDCWVAEQVAERDTLAVDKVSFQSAGGERVTYSLLPHEMILKDLLNEEYV